ncbi:hypothetical protein Q7C36_000538 [Tachysurus vachellii]|uniref:Selenoprotein P N-terminal domain-containing protein n=1 Tax=Tachysurus vachellii TaxID=175792 RepID=A0AA88T886_TACVA|nr:hypothetical protein Q7C36_000538 [Tachysurus vachellii]
MQAVLALCLASLPGLLWASPLFLESDSSKSTICKVAPRWEIDGRSPMNELLGNVVVAAKMGDLRDKLARGNLTSVAFLIVNEQDAFSRAMYWELKKRTAVGIPVFQQGPLQDDVWDTLQGDKDDFLVYDRCGRLTFHIVLPFSFLHYPYVEAAIRATYFKNICNCTQLNSTQITSNNMTTRISFEQNTTATESQNNNHHHHHHHHHHHQHHQHHHHHQDDHSQDRSSLNPVITQTNRTSTVQKHTHQDQEHRH